MNNPTKNIIYCSKCGAEYTYFGGDLRNKFSPCCRVTYTSNYQAVFKRLVRLELNAIKKLGMK